jgi:hypothetical protein
METKIIRLLIIIAVASILAILLYDRVSNKPGKRPENPHPYSMDGYDRTDPALLSHEEIKQINIGDQPAVDLTFGFGRIFLLMEEYLRVITTEGSEQARWSLTERPTCITIGPEETVLIGFGKHIARYTLNGEEVGRSRPLDGNALFTAVAVSDDQIFVADAGNKMVRVFSFALQETGHFKGVSGVTDDHGFILPSPRFDLAVNSDNELWVVNPGLQTLQNYSHDGRLRGYWGKPAFHPEGFSGCCNPCRFAFLPNGDFVTSEKGLVRVKIHKPSGELRSIVAGPEEFPNGRQAPAVTTDEEENIIILDYEQKLIRFFKEKKENNDKVN